MATLTSHTLDSVTGAHAAGIEVELFRIDPDGERVRVVHTQTDTGGRLEQEIELTPAQRQCDYELVFHTGAYFSVHPCGDLGARTVRHAVVRFTMPEARRRYHIPLMLSPNSYSVWWSD